MSVVILHGIAAFLWALAIFFAGIVGFSAGTDKDRGMLGMLAVIAALSVAAFTLQVIA